MRDFPKVPLVNLNTITLKEFNDEDKLSSSVNNLTQAVIDELRKKHRGASPEHPEAMLKIKSELPNHIIYESIDADLIPPRVLSRFRFIHCG